MKKAFDIIYEKLKSISIEENILCKEFWMKVLRLKENFDESEAWNLMVENMQWLINNDVIRSTHLQLFFNNEKLAEHGIYFNGNVLCKDEKVIGFGTAEIIASGHSRVILFDESKAECYDTTFASGHNASSMVLNDCCGEAFDLCGVIAKGYSKAELWGKSTCTALNYSYVIQHENSEVNATDRVHVLKQ